MRLANSPGPREAAGDCRIARARRSNPARHRPVGQRHRILRMARHGTRMTPSWPSTLQIARSAGPVPAGVAIVALCLSILLGGAATAQAPPTLGSAAENSIAEQEPITPVPPPPP